MKTFLLVQTRIGIKSVVIVNADTLLDDYLHNLGVLQNVLSLVCLWKSDNDFRRGRRTFGLKIRVPILELAQGSVLDFHT